MFATRSFARAVRSVVPISDRFSPVTSYTTELHSPLSEWVQLSSTHVCDLSSTAIVAAVMSQPFGGGNVSVVTVTLSVAISFP